MRTEEILAEAQQITGYDRQATYGPPDTNFERIAALWGAYLDGIGRRTLEPHDVALLNVLQKVARLEETPDHEDSWVDICGYGATGGQCATSPDGDGGGGGGAQMHEGGPIGPVLRPVRDGVHASWPAS